MKKIIPFALVLLLLIGCNFFKEKTKPKDYAVIYGEVENFKKRTIEIEGYNLKKKIRFHRKSKTFIDTLTNITPGHYKLKIGKRPVNIYLNSVEDLKLHVDAKRRIKAPVFEGANVVINNYLNKKFIKGSSILKSGNKLFSLKEDEFLSVMDKYKSVVQELAKKSKLPTDYLEKEIRNIHYQFARNLNNYQNFHRILYGDYSFTVSKNFPIEVIAAIDFNNSDDYISTEHYRDLITERLKIIANTRNPKNGDYPLAYLKTIQTEIVNQLIKNDLIHKAAQRGIKNTNDIDEYYKKYMMYSTDAENKKEVTTMYNKLKLIAKGKPSPKFTDIENYKGGTTSLNDLIGKGKYLYIDIWATWCGFCKKETPLLKRLEQQYHGKNIDFVSISVDKALNKKKWRNMIEDKEMTGTQLFAGMEQDEFGFTKDYLIKLLPRFIILDPEGNIVNSNAPRPSDNEKLMAIFEELGI